jgi:hypothetical protein
MTEIVLPVQKKKATLFNPRLLIIFSKPKVGKTSLLSELDNNLIFDFEGGTESYDSMSIDAKNMTIRDLKAYATEIKKAGKPYKYITFDTLTKLEELALPYAEEIYSKTLPGKNWFKRTGDGKLDPTSGKVQYRNILNLPNGSGYAYLREAMTNIIKMYRECCECLILVAHVKDTKLTEDSPSSLDIDLLGKTKRVLSADADAIGYLTRRPEGNYLDFNTSEDVLCGSRMHHLKNKSILISKLEEDGKLTTFWDKVFIPEPKSKTTIKK